MKPLGVDFFDRSVHEVARDLIGCTLLYEGRGGTIVETESYEADDPACHAYVGLTERTFFRHFSDKREVLFQGQQVLVQAFLDGVAAAPPGIDNFLSFKVKS